MLTTRQTRAFQIELNMRGYRTNVDGAYGPKTEAAFRAFCDANGVFRTPFAFRNLIADSAMYLGAKPGDPSYEPSDLAQRWVETLISDFSLKLDKDQERDLHGLFESCSPLAGLWEATPDSTVALIARWFLLIGVQETSQNRGPWVDAIIRIGGGNPSSAPPWCAYFVGCCRELASRLSAAPFGFRPSASAVRTYLYADNKIEGSTLEVPVGFAFTRLRTSLPDNRVSKTLLAIWKHGEVAQGHTGIVVGKPASDRLLLISGNSSGSGHSGGRGGRVAFEEIGPTRGRDAWVRLVGFGGVSAIPSE